VYRLGSTVTPTLACTLPGGTHLPREAGRAYIQGGGYPRVYQGEIYPVLPSFWEAKEPLFTLFLSFWEAKRTSFHLFSSPFWEAKGLFSPYFSPFWEAKEPLFTPVLTVLGG